MVLAQFFLAVLLAGPIVWGVLNWLKYGRNSAPKLPVNYITLINSAVLYALAFNVIFFLQELFLVLGKKALGLKAFLYHNDHNWEGEHPMAPLMQGSGALAIFLTGLICLVIFRFNRHSRSSWMLFVLWLAFHGLIQSIPQVMVAYFDEGTDVGQALVGYLHLSQTALLILAITSMVAIAMTSIWMGRQLLGFAPAAVNLSQPKVKLKYIQLIAVGAGFAGSLLVVPFRIFPISQAITPFIVFAVSIPWVWSSAAMIHPVKRNSNSLNDTINWGPMAWLLLLLAFFRLVLAPGLEF